MGIGRNWPKVRPVGYASEILVIIISRLAREIVCRSALTTTYSSLAVVVRCVERGGCGPRRWNRLCYVLQSKTPTASGPSRGASICVCFAPISYLTEKDREWYGGGVAFQQRTNRWNGWMESEKCRCGLTLGCRERYTVRGKENDKRWLVPLFNNVPDRVHSDSRRWVCTCVRVLCLYDVSSKTYTN